MSTLNEQILTQYDRCFDEKINLASEVAHSPGYHTKIPDGAVVHSTRANLDYALLLLGQASSRHERAFKVIKAVLEQQDTDPTSPSYGIWPWFYEEPLAKMSPPDWNWADFCGARLAEIIILHANLLPTALLIQTKIALGHAAYSIFRRNMGSHYTNIAIMGSTVTAAAGEILSDERLVNYAIRRFEKFVEYTEQQGSFNEYNSPTYTPVAIEECERALLLCQNNKVLELAEKIRLSGWKIIADHFFAPCFEWGGPQSRAYSDRLRNQTQEWLHNRLDEDASEIIACPPQYRLGFKELKEETWARYVYIRNPDSSELTAGQVWRSPQACLASVNDDCLWVQRRPILGYWPSGNNGAAVFRVRFYKDRLDFSSAALTASQDRKKLLVLAGFRNNLGDFHIGLDRPDKQIFTGQDWRLRIHVQASDANVEERNDRFLLSSGNVKIAVIPIPDCSFQGIPLKWESGSENGNAWVDAIVHQGEAINLELADDELAKSLHLGFALQLLTKGEPEITTAGDVTVPAFTENGAVWSDLQTVWPRRCQ